MIGRESSALRELVVLQQGVVSAAQAAACGLSHETLRQRVLRGIWQRPLPGVYVLQGGPVSRTQWLTAAQLYAGKDSVLTGQAALAEYGLELTAAMAPTTVAAQAAQAQAAAPLSGALPAATPRTDAPPAAAPQTDALPAATPRTDAPPAATPRAPDSPEPLPRIPPEPHLHETSRLGGAHPDAHSVARRISQASPLAAPRAATAAATAAAAAATTVAAAATTTATAATAATAAAPTTAAAAATTAAATAAAAAAADKHIPIGRLDLLVPHGHRRQNAPPVHITRTTRLPAPVQLGQLRLAPLARAVIDCCITAAAAPDHYPPAPAARTADRGAIARIISSALADGRVSLADLEYELARAPRRHSSALRAELARARAQSRATAARQFLDGLGRSGPFGALRDVAVYAGHRRVARAAALWPTRAVAAAVDASEHEISMLSTLGFAVVQVSPRRVAEDLGGLLRHVASVLMARPEATMPAGVSLLPLASAHEVSAT